EVGVPRAEDPFVEESLETFTARRLELCDQISRGDDALAVLVEVVVHSAPEDLVPQSPPEHVEDDAAFLVEVPIEEVDGLFVVATHDRPLIVTVGFREVT